VQDGSDSDRPLREIIEGKVKDSLTVGEQPSRSGTAPERRPGEDGRGRCL